MILSHIFSTDHHAFLHFSSFHFLSFIRRYCLIFSMIPPTFAHRLFSFIIFHLRAVFILYISSSFRVSYHAMTFPFDAIYFRFRLPLPQRVFRRADFFATPRCTFTFTPSAIRHHIYFVIFFRCAFIFSSSIHFHRHFRRFFDWWRYFRRGFASLRFLLSFSADGETPATRRHNAMFSISPFRFALQLFIDARLHSLRSVLRYFFFELLMPTPPPPHLFFFRHFIILFSSFSWVSSLSTDISLDDVWEFRVFFMMLRDIASMLSFRRFVLQLLFCFAISALRRARFILSSLLFESFIDDAHTPPPPSRFAATPFEVYSVLFSFFAFHFFDYYPAFSIFFSFRLMLSFSIFSSLLSSRLTFSSSSFRHCRDFITADRRLPRTR